MNRAPCYVLRSLPVVEERLMSGSQDIVSIDVYDRVCFSSVRLLSLRDLVTVRRSSGSALCLSTFCVDVVSFFPNIYS